MIGVEPYRPESEGDSWARLCAGHMVKPREGRIGMQHSQKDYDWKYYDIGF